MEEAFANSPAERIVDELDRALGGQAGLWPTLLPRLRDRAGVKRSELVDRLARALDVSDRAEKVASYYHQMEQGLLPSRGVRTACLTRLARSSVRVPSAARRRSSAHRPGRHEASPAAAVFARRSLADAAAPRAPAPAEAQAQAQAPTEAHDEVDALFTGS